MNSSPPRVLISDPDATSARLLRVTLEDAGYQVSETRAKSDTFDTVVQNKPDLLIYEVALEDGDGLGLCRALRKNTATRALPIILLSRVDGVDNRIAGLEAGADEYFAKPFHAGELVVRVRRLLERCSSAPSEQTQAPAQVIAICSSKGGVGKTTLSVNLAMAIKKKTGKRVVIVDADFYFGNVGVYLNLPQLHSVVDLTQHIDLLDSDLIDQVLLTHPSGVRVLPCPMLPAQAAEITPEHVRVIVARLTEMFDYVIVDCQTNIDAQLAPVLELAHNVLLIATPEVGCLKNTANLLQLIPDLGISLDKVSLVLNRATAKVGLTPREIEDSLRCRIAFQLCAGGVDVAASLNRGIPLVNEQPQHPFAVGISDMAEHLVKEPPRSILLFSRGRSSYRVSPVLQDA